MDYYFVNGQVYSSDELYHHGILGQKWGVRRYQNKDGSLTPAGRKHVKARTIERKYTSPEAFAPLLLFTPHIALLTTTAAMRGYKYCRSKGYAKERERAEIEKKTGLKLKSREMTWKEDLKRVNPDFYTKKENVIKNCMLCSCAYDLRRRGYDVTAAKTEAGYRDSELKKWYPKAKLYEVSGRDKYGRYSNQRQTDNLISVLTKQGNGARGNLMFWWKSTGGGHSVSYEVRDGKVTILDAQTGKIYNNPRNILKHCDEGIVYARLDNIPFDIKQIKGCVDDD